MRIEIDKNLIPYRFDIDLADETFGMEIHYNERFDFFTIDISKDETPIIYGEKVVLNKILFSAVSNPQVPDVFIIPMDESGAETRVSFENFQKTVFLEVGEAAV